MTGAGGGGDGFAAGFDGAAACYSATGAWDSTFAVLVAGMETVEEGAGFSCTGVGASFGWAGDAGAYTDT